jgi:TonB family protein
VNGIAGEDNKPWHLKFHVTLYDQDGKETNHGTYEEYWASPKEYRIIKTDARFSETDYGTESGVVRAGERTEIQGTFDEISDKYLHPLSYLGTLGVPATSKVALEKRDIGPVSLRCITTTYPAASADSIDTYGPTTCIDSDIPALRVLGPLTPNRLFVFDGIAMFRGRYVARDLTGNIDGKRDVAAHLDTLESIDALNEALFVPPPDAKLITPGVPLANAAPQPGEAPRSTFIVASPGVAFTPGQLIRASPPEYPIGAKAMGISGTVTVQVRISKDGHIYDAHAISGPVELRGAAVESVKRWVYRPYKLNGEPIEVGSTVNVMFRLDH